MTNNKGSKSRISDFSLFVRVEGESPGPGGGVAGVAGGGARGESWSNYFQM